MSGFSNELIDYLEGRITFEEFDRRRDERKAKVSYVVSSVTVSCLAEAVSLGLVLHLCDIKLYTSFILTSQSGQVAEDVEDAELPSTSGLISTKIGNLSLSVALEM